MISSILAQSLGMSGGPIQLMTEWRTLAERASANSTPQETYGQQP